jgi:DNA polymerase-3 subunit chi
MAESCQVDFYVLANSGQSAERFACQLAMMAWEQGHRVAVLTENETAARALDEIMWDYPAGRFLPHAVNATDSETPVSIIVSAADIEKGRDVLINLADSPIDTPGRFERLLEIVPAADQKRLASREKFRTYRELGLEPASHKM